MSRNLREAAEERGRRIREEMERLDMTLRDVQRAVKERLGANARGTSYSGLRGYQQGEVDHPRPHLIEAIASVLGVSPSWLMHLEGPRRPSDDRRALDLFPDERRRAERLTHILRAMREAELPFPRDYLTHEMEPALHAAVIDLLESDGPRLEDRSTAEVAAAVTHVAWFWTLPLRALGQTDLMRDPVRFRRFWMAQAQAWSLAMPDPGDGRPDEVIKRIRTWFSRFPDSTDGAASDE